MTASDVGCDPTVELLRAIHAKLEEIHADIPTGREAPAPAPTGAIVPDLYRYMRRAVEEGVAYGWGRAWKYREGEPDHDVAQDCIEKMADGAMSEICERFHFPPVVE